MGVDRAEKATIKIKQDLPPHFYRTQSGYQLNFSVLSTKDLENGLIKVCDRPEFYDTSSRKNSTNKLNYSYRVAKNPNFPIVQQLPHDFC